MEDAAVRWDSDDVSRIRSALFIDFDNIFSALYKIDPRAAEAFSTHPARWLRWIEAGMVAGLAEVDTPPRKRSLLIRHCYLNPQRYAKYRPYFIRSAFAVTDCPPLTSLGKTSADILMAVQILDTLQHATKIDEFILLSGDADFTPVLLRLREHDRRATVFTIGPAAIAFKAACDIVIGEEVFLGVLGLDGAAGSQPAARPPARTGSPAPRILDAMADRLYEQASSAGECPAATLPALFREFEEFRRSHDWLGYWGLRPLADALVARRKDLCITQGESWGVGVSRAEILPSAAGTAPNSAPAVSSGVRDQVINVVREVVRQAGEPVSMARAASEARRRVGHHVLTSHWAGYGTFKDLLLSEPDLGLTIAPVPSPGYIYDPSRHAAPRPLQGSDPRMQLPADTADFANRVTQLTGVPLLKPIQYAALFDAISGANWQQFNFNFTCHEVQDRCAERGQEVSKRDVSSVLRQFMFSSDCSPEDSPATLATHFRQMLADMLKDAEVQLSPEELALLENWITATPQEDAKEPPHATGGQS